ncbi:MAG TPA: TlpA disulfide reductase family protein [Steroidobacteraceae bacterium]|nr:TlpA disulfide reductase family protein [Steroidobacteraceae bacterium]
MRRALAAAGVILGAALAAAALAAPPSIVGKPAPDFVLRGLDGRNLRLSEFRGQVVLVNFWSRSDGDSRQQMPALDRINTTYQRAGLVVLGVSVDEDLRRSKEFAAASGVSYPILFDTGTDIGKDYSLQKMPMTILVDRSGVVRYSAVGFKRGEERVYLDQIRELLRE